MRNWTTNQPISHSWIFAFWEFKDRATWSSKTETHAWRNWIDPNRNKRSDSRPWRKSSSHLRRKSGSDYEEMLVYCWEKEKGERRKRKSLVVRTWGRHVSNVGPTKMPVFTLLPLLLVCQKLKTTESCFQFPWLKLNLLRIESWKLS